MLQRHTQAAPRAYDVIVVLGAAVWPGGQPSPALQCRVLHAVDLLQRGYALHLLVTGGVGQYPPAEAEVMQRLAVAHGIRRASIVLEDQATSTFESALRCRDLLWQRGWSREDRKNKALFALRPRERIPTAGLGQGFLPDVREAVATYWEKIGLKMKRRPVDWAVFQANFRARSYGGVALAYAGPVIAPEPWVLLLIAHSKASVHLPHHTEGGCPCARSFCNTWPWKGRAHSHHTLRHVAGRSKRSPCMREPALPRTRECKVNMKVWQKLLTLSSSSARTCMDRR